MFAAIRQRHKASRVALYLHNDPHTMGGLATPGERGKILARADAVICVSEYVRRRFLSGIAGEGQDNKIHVIPNALAMTVHGILPPAPKARILYVGRMVPEKGIEQLARALATVLPEHPDWRVGFIGSNRHGGGSATEFEQGIRARLAPLDAQVDWFGQMSNEAVQEHMRNACIVVIPSLCNEAFGRVAIEAMSSGCAVISSGRGGLAEATGPAALGVDPEDPAAIASALASLMDDAVRLASARRAGWAYVRQHFDIAGIASRLDDLRESLIGADQ